MLETNLDDVPAEVIGYCFDLLFAGGALDVFSTPIQMKKNRPGVLLSVLAPEAALPVLEEILFRETETFGIRRYPVERHKLQREAVTVSTPWGPVRGKRGWLRRRAGRVHAGIRGLRPRRPGARHRAARRVRRRASLLSEGEPRNTRKTRKKDRKLRIESE